MRAVKGSYVTLNARAYLGTATYRSGARSAGLRVGRRLVFAFRPEATQQILHATRTSSSDQWQLFEGPASPIGRARPWALRRAASLSAEFVAAAVRLAEPLAGLPQTLACLVSTAFGAARRRRAGRSRLASELGVAPAQVGLPVGKPLEPYRTPCDRLFDLPRNASPFQPALLRGPGQIGIRHARNCRAAGPGRIAPPCGANWTGSTASARGFVAGRPYVQCRQRRAAQSCRY